MEKEKNNNIINLQDFKKINLRVGRIINVENLQGYNKILKISSIVIEAEIYLVSPSKIPLIK